MQLTYSTQRRVKSQKTTLNQTNNLRRKSTRSLTTYQECERLVKYRFNLKTDQK